MKDGKAQNEVEIKKDSTGYCVFKLEKSDVVGPCMFDYVVSFETEDAAKVAITKSHFKLK